MHVKIDTPPKERSMSERHQSLAFAPNVGERKEPERKTVFVEELRAKRLGEDIGSLQFTVLFNH